MRPRALVFVAAVLAVACGGPSAPSTQTIRNASADSVTILSATPPSGSTLTAGATVTVTLSFSYELVEADAGTIMLATHDQEYHTVGSGEFPRLPVVRGTGTAQLSYAMAIPSSGVSSVVVALPLFRGSSTSSQSMDSVRYSVQ